MNCRVVIGLLSRLTALTADKLAKLSRSLVASYLIQLVAWWLEGNTLSSIEHDRLDQRPPAGGTWMMPLRRLLQVGSKE